MSEENLKPRVLVVDDVPTNIKVLKEVLASEYRISFAVNGPDALKIVFGDAPPDLVLLDVMMPGMDGYQVIRALKADFRARNIPVIFVTAKTEEEDEAKGFDLGAVDYITKPFSPAIVQARVRTHLELKRHRDHLEDLVRERTRELRDAQFEIVNRLAMAAEFRDNETGQHVRRISHFCVLFAQALGLDDKDRELLFHAATMHDVGKIGIPDHILLKPDRLDEDEFRIMKTHADLGAELLNGPSSALMTLARVIAWTHHEKWDGSGYPRGLKGEEIPLEGRITAICDVFDALTSSRPYKKAWSLEDAVEEIKKGRGRHFDPALVDIFLENLEEFLTVKKTYSDGHHSVQRSERP
ncbi:MAG: two-component system response regulator [Pseudomonadota bacterium]